MRIAGRCSCHHHYANSATFAKSYNQIHIIQKKRSGTCIPVLFTKHVSPWTCLAPRGRPTPHTHERAPWASSCAAQKRGRLDTTRHYTTLHYSTLHYTTLHYTTLHYTTLHYTTRVWRLPRAHFEEKRREEKRRREESETSFRMTEV